MIAPLQRSPSPDGRGSLGYVYVLAGVAALGGLLFGYDTAVISGAIEYLTTHFELDPAFGKGWAAASVLLGCAGGAALAGLVSDFLGRKKTLMLAGLLFLISAIGTAIPPNVNWFVAFRILGGLAIGAASISSPMYIAEVSPARIRGKMVAVNQFAIVTGILLAYFVNLFIASYGTAQDRRVVDDYLSGHGTQLSPSSFHEFATAEIVRQDRRTEQDARAIVEESFYGQTSFDIRTLSGFLKLTEVELVLALEGKTAWNVEHGWRWMFGAGSMPALLFMVLLLLVPESPRWLTKQGRAPEAEAVLARVNGPEVGRQELAAIERAIAEESVVPAENSGLLAAINQRGMRAALIIGIVLAVLQQITGINVFLYFAPTIFKGMGAGEHAALLQQVIVGAVNMSFTILAIWTVDRLGRKPLMLVGSVGMGLTLVSMGLLAYTAKTDSWTNGIMLVCILGYIACFALSVGPVTWVILAEIYPTQIRGRAMALATVCLWLADFVVTQTFPMMDNNKWLLDTFHKAFPFWIYAVFCAVSVVFVWRFVPETKGKTLEEIERSWRG
jgi:SP family xylose:H+ symportor-like MFS transporter